ncbi:MAG TPA: DUF455 family protein [Kofleriaceae bacterium]|nr:DUF455 family protein [Kofleriaceae bacterium]
MNASTWARRVVESDRLCDKLAPPPQPLGLDRYSAPPDGGAARSGKAGPCGDGEPAVRLAAPGRPRELAIVPGKQARVPPIAGMSDPAQRARILHALANHELQAIELFAWALLAFPDAPRAFRRGLAAIAADEQRHFALYEARLAAHGTRFGDHPVTGHFWAKLDHLTGPLEFACAMGLTFEAANLDFAGDYAAAARACGDVATAAALDRVHADEIRHVRFGWQWLRRLAPEADAWEAYTSHVRFPLGPARARGARLDRDARRRAGFDEAFIARLAAIEPKRPSGAPR